MRSLKQAVILAGGLGTRLRPLTNNKPKPMVEIGGKPFLEYLVETLKKNGIEEIVLLLGYMPEKIIGYFGDGSKFGVSIKYSVGEINWETGTRVKNAKNLLDDEFLLMYSDNFWPAPIHLMYDFFSTKVGSVSTVTVYNNKDGLGEYSFENNMQIADNGLVLKYDRSRKDPNLNAIDIGFFILQKSIFDIFPEHNFSFEIEILPKLISQQKLYAFRTDNRYYPLTSISFLPTLEKVLAKNNLVDKTQKII